MSRDTVIEFSGVAKSYGSRRVLKGFDLTVFRGNVYALLGENGEGKTTAIKMAAGQMEPDAGAVTRRNGLRISYLPQMPRYDEARTSVEQVLWDSPKDVGAPDAYEAKALLTQLGDLGILESARTGIIALERGERTIYDNSKSRAACEPGQPLQDGGDVE